MEPTGGPAAIAAFMDTVNRFNGPVDSATLNPESSDTFKKQSIWLYDMAATIAARGEIWNWGMDDPDLAAEIEKVLPGSLDFCTDGVSEQLYFRALHMLPGGLAEADEKRVVEIGSGAGEGLNFLSRAVPTGRFLGVELSPEAVRRANAILARGEELRYVQGDAEQLLLADGSADIVVSVESSHNYPHLDKFFAQVARVLAPGGYFTYLDGYTEHRYDQLTELKRTMPEFEWLSEDDISEEVKAGIRKRMREDSHFRQSSFANRIRNRLKRHIVFNAQASTMGSTFLGRPQSPVIRALDRLGKLPQSWNLPVETYVHSVARRRPV
jgi:ubiquinone/menaquinone biosynthesis C-methylase UbiE